MISASPGRLVGPVLCVARDAGEAILAVYSRDFEVAYKDDKSPLTEADRRSHEIIIGGLAGLQPKFPVLSEEGRDIPYGERSHWEYFWLVDPLDGTKEFIKRNGEFTVNIALIHRTRPVMGVVYVPVKDVLYFAAEGFGAYKLETAGEVLVGADDGSGARGQGIMDSILKKAAALPLPKASGRPFTVVASRSHMSKETEEYLDALRAEHGEIDLVSAGSSLKFCLVAEGRADVYPRLAPTMEWDTAAGQCVAEESGLEVVSITDGLPLPYNKEDLRNGPFVCRKRRIQSISE